MSRHQAFRRQPIPQEYAQALKLTTFPAPTRGLVLNENEAFMQPGGAIVQDNWYPTLRGCVLRGGTERWCDLHALDAVVPPIPSPSRLPVLSAFEYQSGNIWRMFAAQATKLFDVTATTPVLVKSGQTNGNYASAQMANASGDYLIALNDTGDFALRYNGTAWTTLTAVTTPGGGPDGISNIFYNPAKLPPGVAQGRGLVHVWKYRNRLFFIQINSMQAWYLPIDSVGGQLEPIPLSGAASKGGKLLFGATWSLDAGDGIDDKCVFVTDQGEALIFTGTNPGDGANWRQEGRYQIGIPLGKNASISVGGDLLVLTVDGIVPLSQAIVKDANQLELALISRPIKPMWREEVDDKREYPWTVEKWDELGGLFITLPGGTAGNHRCLGMNGATNAFCRLVGWDAMCFVRMRADFFFGTQQGTIEQAERTGTDNGAAYVATLVGGWETLRSGSAQSVWHQARAVFTASNREPFYPQLDATVDYVVTVPPPPAPGEDPGVLDVWDQGKWGPDMGGPPPPVPTQPQRDAYAQWDQPAPGRPSMRNTMWMSIGKTGFSHAPIVQVTVAQQAKPVVELVAVAATFEAAGVNV